MTDHNQDGALVASDDTEEIFRGWDSKIADLPSEISLERATAEAGHVVSWMRHYEAGAHLAKFALGAICFLVNPSWRTDRKYGESIVETIADRHGIHPNLLREARRTAELFSLDLRLFYEWLTEDEDVKTWTQVRHVIRAHSDPSVLGPEALAERLAKRIESTGEDLQKLREQAHEGVIDEETYDGVRQNFVDDINSFAQEDPEEVLEDQSQETARDEEYLDFVRSQPCAATGSAPPNEPHHVEQRGTAMVGSDLTAIPLCREVHDLLEDEGHRVAEKKYNFSIIQSAFETIHEYITGRRPQLPPDISFRRRGPKSPHQNGSVSEHA